ncbi:hypothetical protein [Actinoplanes sp. NPDC049681]|uniref:hypothetical protein n=1 Tax=Actinoplanes sp. NPDC049681 TaxID=3363905 RepID=UPI0037872EC2
MLFGIYPGGASGGDAGALCVGPPDVAEQVTAALADLQGSAGRPFLVRAYLGFRDPGPDRQAYPAVVPADPARYAVDGRRLDIVAQYQSASGDVAGYCRFLREVVAGYGAVTDRIQVAEEPNVTGNPVLDGFYPRVGDAVIAGVSAVKQHARELGHHHLKVGFNTTPLFGPAASFVADLTGRGGPRFAGDLDYVGLDFFPDVFQPVAAPDLAGGVEWLLRRHRGEVLEAAGLGRLPLRITEHGWPTGPGRSPVRQAEVVDTVVRTVAGLAGELLIDGYSHFALRDADSTRADLFHLFGLTADDYTRKPAFDVYRSLIAEWAR